MIAVRLPPSRAKCYGETSTKLKERSRGGGWSASLAEAFGKGANPDTI
jgi:hypothetical protein